MDGQLNWYDKLADWGWTLVVALAGGVLLVVRRVFTNDARITAIKEAHEARLAALEKGQSEGIAEIRTLEQKIDGNQDRVMGALDGLRRDISEDRRLVTSALLERVPKP